MDNKHSVGLLGVRINGKTRLRINPEYYDVNKTAQRFSKLLNCLSEQKLALLASYYFEEKYELTTDIRDLWSDHIDHCVSCSAQLKTMIKKYDDHFWDNFQFIEI